MNQEQKDMISKLKKLSKNAKKAPWHHGGNPSKDGKTTYKLARPEEDLIIMMRNHIDELIKMVEEKNENTSNS